jgi:hypothetical protein
MERREGQRPGGRDEGDDVTAYETAVLADSPKGYWKLGEGSGTTATDSSGNSHNGTYGSGITWANAGVNDPDDCIRVHQTANDYMQVGDHADFKPTTAIAVEVWGSFGAANGNQRIVQKGTSDQGLRIYWNGSTILAKLRIAGIDREISYVHPAAWLTDGQWHHVVFTWASGAKTELWIDKTKVVESGSTFAGSLDTNTDALEWGRKGSGDSTSDHWNGFLDEAAFYAAALNSTQIASHYDSAAVAVGSGLTLTQEMAEAVVTSIAAPGLRLTQAMAEAVVRDTAVDMRLTQLMVECVVERDYAGWETLIVDDESFSDIVNA